MDSGLERVMTLVSGSAGFGKSTLISEWVGKSQRRIAWLSLDESDNDPTRFLTYLIAALRNIEADFGEDELELLDEPNPVVFNNILISLINQIDDSFPACILVLEDYHVIQNSDVHGFVSFLLDHCPQALHLVISTRADPPLAIARMRARSEISEIRTDQLRFTYQEVEEFFLQVMGIDMTQDQIRELDSRTEGWVAGLQMAALSLRAHQDVDEFIRSFTGSHRFILDYLVEEVLSAQSEEIQEFLLDTSILERLSTPLCDHVCEIDDSQKILSYLDQANLFLIPLDDQREWYRYHHMFADLLANRLEQTRPGFSQTLHQRASEWHERSGPIEAAIEHAFASGNRERAADLVERYSLQMFHQSKLATVSRLMARIPIAMIRDRPWLCIYHAWALYWVGKRDQVDDCLQYAESQIRAEQQGGARWAAMQSEERRKVRGYIAALRAYNQLVDIPFAIEMAKKAIDLLPEGDSILATTGITMGGAYWGQGDVVASERSFAGARQIALKNGFQAIAVSAACYQGTQQQKQGQLQLARDTYLEATELARRPSGRLIYAYGLAEVKLGKIYLEWNDLVQAESYIVSGLERLEQLGNVDFLVEGLVCLAEICWAQNDVPRALDAIQRAVELESSIIIDPWVVTWLYDMRIRTLLALGKLQDARGIVEKIGLQPGSPLDYLADLNHVMLLRVLLAQGVLDNDEDLLHQALSLADRLIQAARAAGWVNEKIRFLTLKALIYKALEDQERALGAIREALRLGEPGGYVRVYLDGGEQLETLLRWEAKSGNFDEYIAKIINAKRIEELRPVKQSHHAPGTVTGGEMLVEPLSARELDVLGYLFSALSVPEIADEMTISPSTVRSHIKNIYGKLGVHSRIEAVNRAKELGLA